MGLTLLFCLRGIPQIYYGDEIGLEGGRDPDNRRDMPWHWMSGEAGSDGPTQEYPHARAIFHHVKALIRLNKAHEALQYGASITLYTGPNLFVFLREFRESVVVIAIHNGWNAMPEPVEVHVSQNPHLPKRLHAFLEGKTLQNELGKRTEDISSCVHSETPTRPLIASQVQDQSENERRIQSGSFLLQLPGRTSMMFVPRACGDESS
jgi:alpha-amylase